MLRHGYDTMHGAVIVRNSMYSNLYFCFLLGASSASFKSVFVISGRLRKCEKQSITGHPIVPGRREYLNC